MILSLRDDETTSDVENRGGGGAHYWDCENHLPQLAMMMQLGVIFVRTHEMVMADAADAAE